MFRRVDALVVLGIGLLVAGLMVSAFDHRLVEHWYDWVLGPAFWILGLLLVLVWLWARLTLVFQKSDKDTQPLDARFGKYK